MDPCTGSAELLDTLKWLDECSNWSNIAKECGMEKQIEIRAELRRTIKKLEKYGN